MYIYMICTRFCGAHERHRVCLCLFVSSFVSTRMFSNELYKSEYPTRRQCVYVCVSRYLCRHVWVQAHFQTSRKQVSIQLTPLNKTGRPIRNQSWAPAPPSKKQRHQQHSSTNDTEMCTTPKPRQVYFCVKSLGKNKCNTFASLCISHRTFCSNCLLSLISNTLLPLS